MWNYDQKEIQKKIQHGQITRWTCNYQHGEKIVFCQKINLVAAYTQRIIVQSEYKKELHY